MKKYFLRTNSYIIKILAIILFCSAGLLQAAETYTNPVISEIGPADPTILFHEGKYYMYPTGDNTSYHVYTSDDLVNWTKGRKVFEPGGKGIWAPDVFYNAAEDKFYLYYTAGFKIGVAVADKPDGSFVDKGLLLEGFIDAHLFQDDGKYYLYFTDVGHIYVQQMEDLLKLKGERKMILQPSQPWEKQQGNVNEGPWMIKHKGTYYLLYSGNGADSRFYGVGYATASDPMGPFTKYEGNPIVKPAKGLYGPGHGAVITDAAGDLWHIYHQKNGPDIGWDRFICIDPMKFDDDGVLHGIATRGTPQPAPVCSVDKKPVDKEKQQAPKWADISNWGKIRKEMSEKNVIKILGRPVFRLRSGENITLFYYDGDIPKPEPLSIPSKFPSALEPYLPKYQVYWGPPQDNGRISLHWSADSPRPSAPVIDFISEPKLSQPPSNSVPFPDYKQILADKTLEKWQQPARWEKLHKGMKKDAVVSMLGKPKIVAVNAAATDALGDYNIMSKAEPDNLITYDQFQKKLAAGSNISVACLFYGNVANYGYVYVYLAQDQVHYVMEPFWPLEKKLIDEKNQSKN